MDIKTDRPDNRRTKLTSAPPAAPSFGTKKKAKRAKERTPTFRAGRILYSGRNEIGCIVKDMTDTGARIVLDDDAGLSPEVTMVISQTAAKRAAKVAWQKDREVGLSFTNAGG